MLENVALEIGHELPFGREFFADCEGHLGHAAQRFVCPRGLVADWLFEEIERALSEFLAERGGFGHAEAVMIFHTENGRVAQFGAYGPDPIDGGGDRFTRFIDRFGFLESAQQANAVPAGIKGDPGLFHHLGTGVGRNRCKGGNALTRAPAQELIDRNAERLALDVVARNVDGRDGGCEDAPAFEILAAIELLPDPCGLHGIAADQELGEMLDGTDDGLFTEGKAGFAPPMDALVGFDLDEQLVANAYPDRIRLDCRYFH